MLNQNQLRVFASLIINHIGYSPAPQVIAGYVGEERAHRLPGSFLPIQKAQWLIDQALAWPDPSVLLMIIDDLDRETSREAFLVALADELRADPARWPAGRGGASDGSLDTDPPRVLDGRPFVDRASFRRLLPRLGATDTPGCTVVFGDPGHGKSYLHEFCKRLRQEWGEETFRVGYAECPDSHPSAHKVGTIAMSLATGLRADPFRQPREHEDPFRYARNLAAWIAHGVAEAPLPGLAILDGFDLPAGGAGIREEVLLFIEELIREVQDNEVAHRRLRVVLLDYEVGRLEDAGLDYQTSVLEAVDETAIRTWFGRSYPGRPDFEYQDAARQIHAKLEADAGDDASYLRMNLMCTLVDFAARRFEQGP